MHAIIVSYFTSYDFSALGAFQSWARAFYVFI